MGTIAAALLLLAGTQEGEVDRIMFRFEQRRAQAQDDAQFRRLLEDTRAELERHARESPRAKDAPRAAFHAAETFLWAGEPKEGEARLRRLLEEFPDCEQAPSVRFLRGEILFQIEEEEAARAAFEEFVRLHPKDERVPSARIYAAATLQGQKRYDEAAEALQAVHKDYAGRRESWDALLQLAIVRHIQERPEDARRALEQVIREGPDNHIKETARRHLTEYLTVGQPVPSARVKDQLENEFCLEDHRGKVVVAYFFDSAVRESESEADFIRRAREQFKDKDVRFLGVSISRARKDFEVFRNLVKPGWTLFYDGQGLDGRIARLFNVRGLPWLVVADRQGKIRFFNIARRDLRNAIEKLLEEK
jgi:TolA-binding protein